MEMHSVPVLVVDDDVLVADMLVDLLQVCGITAMAVYSGSQALGVLHTWQPKVILLDIRMPILDGYETAKAIRSLPGWDNVAILALSGWHGSEGRAYVGTPLFDRCLTKPAKLETIVEALQSVLNERGIAVSPAVSSY